MRVPPSSERKQHPSSASSAASIERVNDARLLRYEIACQCGRPHSFAEQDAGTSVACACGQPVNVPSLQELRQRAINGDIAVTVAQPSASVHSKPTPALSVIGGIIVVVGIGLFVGNVSGLFTTFSGAGWLTIALGSLLIKAGQPGKQ